MTVQRCPQSPTGAQVAGNVKSAMDTLSHSGPSGRKLGVGRRNTALVGTPLLVAGVACAAANLRPAVTSLASVLEEVRVSVGAGETWAGLLTAVPAVCFGAAGVLAPKVGRSLGVARAIGAAMAVLTLGLLLRVLDGPWVVLAGTLVACAGIAVGNVLIPVVIKSAFPRRVGVVTGVYTAALAAGGGLGAALTSPLSTALGGWRGALAAWALLGAGALLVWSAGARHSDTEADVAAAAAAVVGRSLLRNRLAWTVTAFFGLQALVAYTVMGWMPELFVDAGLHRDTAGLMLAITSLIGVPVSLLVPPLAARARDQSAWIVGMTLIGGVGVLGLWLAPAAAPLLWAVLVGVGMSVFSLAVMVISLRTGNAADTATLSAMAQSLGYLIGALGPFAFGSLHSLTGGWTASLVLILAVIAVQAVVGHAAGRTRTV
ncbi:MFS transporter [Actinokineospora spheciospongiae]|uniref:MFS transporter n=1 Tax=Actinokineospora spheciospongiae TaxID=909613 RepID=UPI000D8CE320|nr:MFS transporter [Actinokineospora spheciospongiae]PWW54208.1 CP family cyanate transporter-like MFS transporter [Actinokineospora spheciospongiae]